MYNSDVINDFKVVDNEFTVFVIGQTYFCKRGHDYLSQFINSNSWIASDLIIEKRIKRLLSWIQKNTPNIAELVEKVFMSFTSTGKLGIVDIIIALSKLFSATEHVAAGPEVIDPIIIEEDKVSKRNLTQYVTMHEKCRHRPAIIVLLKDDDYERAKLLLSGCPNGMNVKMISNSGVATHYKVINNGAKNVEEFIDSYARQCFSTCSKTDHGILTTTEWSDDLTINKFSPTIFQIRSTFIKEDKLDAAPQIRWLNNQLNSYTPNNSTDELLKNSFLCMSKLFDVYCFDQGGEQLKSALDLANELNNDILKAHVYRYSHFFDCSRETKKDMLQQAEDVFTQYDILDHAVYCRNNRLIHQFSMDRISTNDFSELEGKAIYDTPGLALMAHIINNVGVAYLFEHHFSSAINAFERGLEYATNNHIQDLALRSNILIAKALDSCDFNEIEARSILRTIFGAPSLGMKRMPFLTAQYALNVIGSAFMSTPHVATQLMNEYKITELVQSAFSTNIMGTGSMIQQIEVLAFKYCGFKLHDHLKFPSKRTSVSGIRLDFICNYGLNPFFFNTWL